MLNEKYKYDLEYAKGMKKVCEMNSSVSQDGSLFDEATRSTREYMFSLHTHYYELSTCLKQEIIEPSKKMLEDQTTLGKKLYNDIKKLDKDYKESLAQLEKLKMKFLTSAKNAELSKLDSELARLSYIPQPEKDKFNSKCMTALKEAKDAETNYINGLTTINIQRNNYIDNSKNILFNFQLLEEDFTEFTKNILRKFYIFNNAAFKNSAYDTERVYLKTEDLAMGDDIKNFIQKNNTNLSPPLEIEYVPYYISLRNKPIEESNYPAEVAYNVIVTIQSLFKKVANEYFDPIEEKKKIQISEISKIACKGELFTEEHHTTLIELLKEHNYRLHFLSYLNRYRTNGIFSISKNSFDVIGDVLIHILDKVIEDKDYESAKYCIILSQTYHYVNDEGSKISLQEKIEDHSALKNIFFWENFIAYSIFEEIEKQTNSNLNESEEEKNNRISNIVFSQLLPTTDNMLSFEVEKEQIKNLILSFSKQYGISDDMNVHLIQMVDEKVYLPKIKTISIIQKIADEENQDSVITNEIKEYSLGDFINKQKEEIKEQNEEGNDSLIQIIEEAK